MLKDGRALLPVKTTGEAMQRYTTAATVGLGGSERMQRHDTNAAPSDGVADNTALQEPGAANSPVALINGSTINTTDIGSLGNQDEANAACQHDDSRVLSATWARMKLPACQQDETHVCRMPATYPHW